MMTVLSVPTYCTYCRLNKSHLQRVCHCFDQRNEMHKPKSERPVCSVVPSGDEVELRLHLQYMDSCRFGGCLMKLCNLLHTKVLLHSSPSQVLNV